MRAKPSPQEASMITSKLTSKAQTTIPQAVRHHLGLKEGDMLGFAIEGDRVTLIKALQGPQEDAAAVFGEWESQTDARAYDGL